jgi:hypothetical protein
MPHEATGSTDRSNPANGPRSDAAGSEPVGGQRALRRRRCGPLCQRTPSPPGAGGDRPPAGRGSAAPAPPTRRGRCTARQQAPGNLRVHLVPFLGYRPGGGMVGRRHEALTQPVRAVDARVHELTALFGCGVRFPGEPNTRGTRLPWNHGCRAAAAGKGCTRRRQPSIRRAQQRRQGPGRPCRMTASAGAMRHRRTWAGAMRHRRTRGADTDVKGQLQVFARPAVAEYLHCPPATPKSSRVKPLLRGRR